MTILAIDTSQPVGSITVSTGAASESIVLERSSSHLLELGGAVDTLITKLGKSVRDIDRIAIVAGPGSFTGLRIGMAYIKGIYATFQPEIVVMTSLELLAVQVSDRGLPVSPMIDARRDEVYAALYRPEADAGTAPGAGKTATTRETGSMKRRTLRTNIAPRAATPEKHLNSLDVSPTVFIGSGALKYRGEIENVFGAAAVFPDGITHRPDTELFCRIAPELTPRTRKEIIAMEPFYIRPSDAKLKRLRAVRTHD